jgi:hypothetical protein
LPWRGRELYLPQVAIGRLVEKPSEILAAIDVFLARPLVAPTNALVTGYDFLSDQAQAISNTLVLSQGLTSLTALINDTWTDNDLRARLFTANAPDVDSLNSHFQHYRLLPANPSSQVFASEVTGTTDYRGAIVFSVGCHSGLNVADEESASLQTGTDWAQAFTRQGATYIGNTGYGYGDSDLIAYSERLMLNFATALGDWSAGPQTVGEALVQAKQRYFNSASAGSLSNYDEKVMAQATLYGLPMLRVNMPITTTTAPSQVSETRFLGENEFLGVTTGTVKLSFSYVPHTTTLGTYYTVAGQDDVNALGGRPVEPRVSVDVHVQDTIAHGALWLGGSFADAAIDPLISRVVTEETLSTVEPPFPFPVWYPLQLGTVNRFLTIGGQSRERLVVVPGQFKASNTTMPTVGGQRLYSSLDYEIYHAPFTATDFIAPGIWQVEAIRNTVVLQFRVRVDDDSGRVSRVVVLYRALGSHTWSKAELVYDAATGWAEGKVGPATGPIEYVVQAVDATGNVALALDHGNPFTRVKPGLMIYLPLSFRQ